MRALRLEAPRQAAVIDVPEPVAAPGEVVVRISACGVCGSDLNAWRGVAGIEYPFPAGAPGHEMVGEVVALGEGVTGLCVGDRVTGLLWNGFAEYGVGRAENLVTLPQGVGDVLGEPLACATNVLRRAVLGAGQRFAIVGFGYLAALLVQLKPSGSGPWVAISRREDSRALALRLGAEAAYDFDSVPSELWDQFPVVLEAAGVQQTLDFATWLTAFGGRLVIAGYHADGPRTVNMQSWNWKGIDVINAHERTASVYVDALRRALEAVSVRGVDVGSLHTHRLRLEDVGRAFELAESRPPGLVKVIVCP